VNVALGKNEDGQWGIASFSGPGASQDGSAEAVVEGQGRVVTLMGDIGMVEIDHERIEAIDMPAMSMVYELTEGVTLDGLAEGDHVRFTIDEAGPGQWQLTAISVMSMGDAGGEE